jgi:Zn-dependent M28 family amino/carboxypeptidase
MRGVQSSFVKMTAFALFAVVLQSTARGAESSITSSNLLRHIQVLSSDKFEGRAPGTRGETLTVEYITQQFREMRLGAGNPDGTFVQKVPLVGFRAEPNVRFTGSDGTELSPAFPTETVVWSRRFIPEVTVKDSDVVFVGYGIVAPEYGWDDYKGVDVRGKTIVMLINDPPIPDPNDSSKLDEKMFKGRAMTYYGRWTYKYEIATEKGAAAAIIVHETIPAAYPWAVVQGSNSRENFDLEAADKNMGRVAVEGWVTQEIAERLCKAGGKEYADLKKAALKRDFRPVPLGVKASISVKNTLREIASTNVVAKVEGSDPKLKNQYIVYTAHWDHLGRDPQLRGDQIYNGAVDNATGTAALLEIGRAFASAKPRRSVLFLSVTAEEKGLLGAKYYATHPLYPLKQTVANINMDALNVWGRTRDVEVVGAGQSTLEDVLEKVAKLQGRVIRPESQPEKGSYFRSDHFEFAKQGVPALDAHSGVEMIGRPEGFGLKKRDEYTAQDYHKVTDEIKPDWDLSGMVEEAELLLQVGLDVANSAEWPEWKSGSEFKARRQR